MDVTEETTVTVKSIVDILCDRCGQSCIPDGMIKQPERGVYRASWGYDSDKDLDYWEADLCEDCSDAFKEWVEAAGGTVRISNHYLS